jgi:hypothetical protein
MLCPVLDQWKPAPKQHLAQTINRLHKCLCNDRSTAMKWADPGKFHFVLYNAIMMPFPNFGVPLDFQIAS